MDHRDLYKAGPMTGNNKQIAARSQAAKRAMVRQNAFDNHREIISEEDAPMDPVLPTKQERHYNKFLEWRKQKQEQNKASVPRKRPFTSAVPRNKFLSPQAGLLTNRTLRANFKSTGFTVSKLAAPIVKPASPPFTRSRRAALLAAIPQSSSSTASATVTKETTAKPPKSTQKSTSVLTKTHKGDDANQNVFKPPPVVEPRSVRNLPAKPVIETKSINSLNVPITPVRNSFGALASSTAQKTGRRQTPVARIEELFSPIDNINMPIRKSHVNNPVAATKSVPEPLIVDLDVTPLNTSAAADTSVNYLSPFVTTARGKGSAHRERKNRDSVYRLEQNRSIEEPVENRRRKEAALYFRGQVDDESNRLLLLIAGWEDYKGKHINALDSEYIDQIDVAIGQTRLLVTRKFNQFRKLVDQCESCVEEAQPVLAEDLEGFWSMVYMQVENCDKRFNKLTMLKANNWIDVEVAPTVSTGAIRKARKAKHLNVGIRTGGNNEFVMHLKKIQADLKQKKDQQRTQTETIIIATPRFVSKNVCSYVYIYHFHFAAKLRRRVLTMKLARRGQAVR